MIPREPLINYLLQHRRKLRLALKKVANTSSKHGVHALRVESRRLQSVASVFRRDLTINRVKHRIGKLNKKLGKVRELDVLIHDLNSFGLDSKRAKKYRKKRRKSLSAYLSRKRKKLARCLDALEGLKSQPSSARFTELTQALPLRQEKFKTADLHRVRIDLKKARYLLEALGEVPESTLRLQAKLGEIHDLEVLARSVPKNHEITRKLRRLVRDVRRIGPKGLQQTVTGLNQSRVRY